MAVTQSNTKFIRMSAAADTLGKKAVISYIRWVGGDATDTLQVSDGNGTIIAESEAATSNYVDMIFINDRVDNLTIDVMGSGSLGVYLA